jgi:hypothetical protein
MAGPARSLAERAGRRRAGPRGGEATDVHGAVVVNGISANRYPLADLSEARDLGYQPVDDAWATRD